MTSVSWLSLNMLRTQLNLTALRAVVVEAKSHSKPQMLSCWWRLRDQALVCLTDQDNPD